MTFQTYIPCDALKPFVRSFAIQETSEETTYRVLPDTGLVMGFQYQGRLSQIENGTEKSLAVSGVSGLADHSRTFKNSPDIGTVLVFFREAGAVPFFKQPLHELFRKSVSLDNFMLRSELLCLEEQLAEATSDPKRISAVENFLCARLTNTEPDKLVLTALSLIHKSRGNNKNKTTDGPTIHQPKSVRKAVPPGSGSITEKIRFHRSPQKCSPAIREGKLFN